MHKGLRPHPPTHPPTPTDSCWDLYRAHTHTHIHTYTHTHIHTYTHTHIHTYTHTHIHTYTSAPCTRIIIIIYWVIRAILYYLFRKYEHSVLYALCVFMHYSSA
eukprot:gene13488-9295_t